MIGENGAEYGGHQVVEDLLDRSVRAIIRQRLTERREQLHQSIRGSAQGIVKDVEDLIQRFDALETP